MTEQDFFARVQETLEVDDPIDRSTQLEDFEEYDSLGILNLMTLFDELRVEVDQTSFVDVRTGADLLRLAGDAIDA
jgi:hypothetical protein